MRLLPIALLLTLLLAAPAHADTIVVNAGGSLDDPDKTAGSGPCETETDGQCTLRAALQTANLNPGKDTIAFALESTDPHLRPSTPLPPITSPLLIDGWSAAGANPATGIQAVELDGANVPMPDPGSHGSTITVKAPFGLDVRAVDTEIRGLAVHSFASAQIALSGADRSVIAGNRVGLDLFDHESGEAIVGVYVYNTIGATIGGATADTRNTISGNWNGVLISGSRSIGTLVHGNFVGTDPSGLGVIGNRGNGILVTNNLVAGAADSTLVAGNLVAGNQSGIRVVAASNTTVLLNWVGLTATGLAIDAFGNRAGNDVGIDVVRAKQTLVGGGEEAWGNVVAASTEAGIAVSGAAMDTRVEGNIVGTDPSGLATVDWMGQPTGGAQAGILVASDPGGEHPRGVTIGGPKDIYANLSSGNVAGIAVLGGAEDVTLQRNLVGTDLPGLAALPNDIGVGAGPADDGSGETPERLRIGTPGNGNVLSGNRHTGVILREGSRAVAVKGNRIGPAFDNHPLGNHDAGVAIGGSGHVIEENVIAGNGQGGIGATADASDVAIRANQIKDNGGPGVIAASEDGTHFPGRLTVEHNFVTGNAEAGIKLGEDVSETVVRDNAIGANDGHGVHVRGAHGVLVAGNQIEDNARDGVHVEGETETIVIGWNADEQPLGGCVERCNTIARNGGAGVFLAEQRPVAVRGNRFAENTAIDVGEPGPQPIDAFDDDEQLNPPAGVHGTVDRQRGETAITGELAVGFEEGTKVDLYGLTDAPAAERARSGTFIGTAFPDARGHFVLRTQAAFASYMGVAVDPDGHSSESSLVCSAHDGSSDFDGDALCDDWEIDGIDYDADGNVDYELDSAQPGRLDVLVEADYTEGSFWGPDTAPSQAALRAVTAAFEDAPEPVHLDVELGEELDRADGRLGVAMRGAGDHDDLRDLRYGSDQRECDGAFGEPQERAQRWCFALLGAKGLAFRYAVFTDRLDGASAGGAAAGDALAIGVGGWPDADIVRIGGGRGTCVTVHVCRSRVQAAVLMHELGHALGLEHGRDQFAPNYLSVMNGTLTFPFVLPDRPLDFSRAVLPTLHEGALSEPAGIGADAREWSETVRMTYDERSDTCVPEAIPAAGPVDWNDDGDTADTGVVSSLNEPDADPDSGLQGCQPPQAAIEDVEGADDWSHLQFDQRAVRSTYDESDRDAEGLGSDLARLTGVMDTDGDGTPNGADNCTRRANAGQADGDGDGIGDACLALIDERDVSLSLAGGEESSVGQPLELTATLRNDYPLPATGLRVRVPVPDGWALASAGGDYEDGVWRVDSLPQRSSAILTLRVVPEVEGERALVAELIAADQPDPDSTPGGGGEYEDDRVALALDPIPEEVVVGVSDARVQEGNRAAVTARVRLTLPRTWRHDVPVQWRTVAGTAGEADFAAGEGSVTIAAGERTVTIAVPVKADRLVEETERFTLALTASGARLERSSATIVIADNDAPARPGQLDYLGCLSEDRGPLSVCENTAPGMREPQTVLSADARFRYLFGENDLMVVSDGGVRQCLVFKSVEDGCERLLSAWTVRIMAATFSPDGRFLYLLTRHTGTGRETGLVVLARDPETGKLSVAACYEGFGGCAPLPLVDGLDVVRDGHTELRADATQLLAISDAAAGEAGRLVTFERAADGTLSRGRCYDEGPQSGPPCLPLDAPWGPGAAAAPTGSGWLVRSGEGLMALARGGDGRLSVAPCPACSSFTGAGDVEVAADAVYVSDEATLTWLTPDLRAAGCAQDAGLAEDRCPVRVEGLAGLRGLTLAPDGHDLYANSPGGGVLSLHRGDDGAIVAGECVVAETESSRCGDGEAGGGLAFADGEVWTAVDGVLARFIRFSAAPANRPPLCVSGTAHTQPGRAIDVALRCSDPDGDPVTLEVTRPPALGTLEVDGEGAGRYTPTGRGTDAIGFRASDGRDVSAEAVLTVLVDDLAPVCVSGRQGFRVPVAAEIAVDCHDPEGGPLTVQVVDAPHRGTLNGLTYRYADHESIETAFTFTATDTAGNVSAPARMELVLSYFPPVVPPDLSGPGRPSTGADRPSGNCRAHCAPDSHGNVPVTVTCPRDASNVCTGDVRICDANGCRTVGRATAVLGSGAFKLRPGASRTVKVKLKRALRVKLKRKRTLKARLEITLRRPGAAPLVTARRITLRARK